ncbi:MAG: adenylyltransferase/cytidyltransferase family protein [Erysipelotrichales bacterium]|nr:adenylyltransferase/cytidyltransferase family protein [Erysipelotrichales bacterium]
MGEKKRMIGYTTGVFDMFHVGHLNIIKRAKEQCDYLIVGVSTDELCISYKGKAPVIPFEERKSILEAIKYVDKVVAQYDRDKYDAWKKLKFDLLFVGDDWKDSTFFNSLEEQFSKENVKIVYFPYTPSVSSSKIRERYLKHNNPDN